MHEVELKIHLSDNPEPLMAVLKQYQAEFLGQTKQLNHYFMSYGNLMALPISAIA